MPASRDLVWLAAFVAAACYEPDAKPDADVGARTGRVVGPAIAGLRYELLRDGAVVDKGVTGAAGEYPYFEGDRVRFLLGDVDIGQVPASPEVTLFAIRSLVPPTSPVAVRAVQAQLFGTLASEWGTFGNIVRLVLSADLDQNAENGVQIPIAFHDLVANRNVRVDVPPSLLAASDVGLVIGDIKESGLWTNGFRLLTPQQALSRIYKSLSIAAETDVVETLSTDNDGNGSLDSMQTNFYDPQGRLIGFDVVDPATNTLRSRHRFSLDGAGRIIARAIDSDGDGDVDSRSNTTFDARGSIILTEVDSDNNGTIDSINRSTVDIHGHLLRRESDSPAGGPIEIAFVRTFNQRGLVTVGETRLNDGAQVTRTTLSYNGRDLNVMSESDSDNNGIVDSRNTRTFGTFDLVVRDETDSPLGAPTEAVTIYGYDGNYHLTSTIAYAPDNSITRKTTYTLNSRGQQTQVLEDGPTGVISRTLVTYNATGQLIKVETDSDGNGTINRRQSYTYDDEGRQVSDEQDYDDNGMIDFRTTQTYKRVPLVW